MDVIKKASLMVLDDYKFLTEDEKEEIADTAAYAMEGYQPEEIERQLTICLREAITAKQVEYRAARKIADKVLRYYNGIE